jgi:hypothetical protein
LLLLEVEVVRLMLTAAAAVLAVIAQVLEHQVAGRLLKRF